MKGPGLTTEGKCQKPWMVQQHIGGEKDSTKRAETSSIQDVNWGEEG